MKTLTCFVWTSSKTIRVTGVLHPFVAPEKQQACTQEWCAIRNQRFNAGYEKVQLFNVRRKWWLYYGRHMKPNGKPDYTKIPSMTGSFESRAKAVQWFNHGGR